MLAYQFAFHCEDADLQVRRIILLKRLVIPDHFVHVERDLLIGLVSNNVRDALGGDGRQLRETRQGVLAGHAHHHKILGNVIVRQEPLQGAVDQFHAIGVRLSEYLGVLDEIVRHELNLAVAGQAKFDGLEGAAPEVNAPNGLTARHAVSSP